MAWLNRPNSVNNSAGKMEFGWVEMMVSPMVLVKYTTQNVFFGMEPLARIYPYCHFPGAAGHQSRSNITSHLDFQNEFPCSSKGEGRFTELYEITSYLEWHWCNTPIPLPTECLHGNMLNAKNCHPVIIMALFTMLIDWLGTAHCLLIVRRSDA